VLPATILLLEAGRNLHAPERKNFTLRASLADLESE
jgi:hypothetical protein